jgi:hypothetical protein
MSALIFRANFSFWVFLAKKQALLEKLLQKLQKTRNDPTKTIFYEKFPFFRFSV